MDEGTADADTVDAGAVGYDVVGVVDDDAASELATAIEDAGGKAVVEDASALATADVDAVVAPREPTVYDCVRARVGVPVLAVGANPALRSVAAADADEAIDALLSGDVTTHDRRTLAVDTERIARRRALADVMLVTSEPARISEYGIHTTEATVGRFRADGIVLATPVGSQGYARAAGSHVLAPQTEVLAAVPIAPFATAADDWVVPDRDVTLTVERDEGSVSLRVDDRYVTDLEHTEHVHVTPDDPFTLAATPQSTGPWPHALEKH